MKKLISALLIFAMLLTTASISVFATENDNISTEDFGFELRLMSVFNAKLSEMKELGDNSTMRISGIKTILPNACRLAI